MILYENFFIQGTSLDMDKGNIYRFNTFYSNFCKHDQQEMWKKLLQIIYCKFLHDSEWEFFFQPASMDMDKREMFRFNILFFSLSLFFLHNKQDVENNWKYFKFIFTLDSYMILNENFFYKLHLWIWLKERVLGSILFSILTFVNKMNWGYKKYLKVYE